MWVLAELHHVTSQSSCLVAKYVLNLTKFLIDVRSLCVHRKVLVRIVHVNIPSHESALPKLYNFKCDYQRDRYKIGEDKDPSSCLLDEQKAPGWCPCIFIIYSQVYGSFVILWGPRRSDYWSYHGSENLDGEHNQYLLICDLLDVADLVDGSSWVHLNLWIVSCVDDHSDNMLCVSQWHAT